MAGRPDWLLAVDFQAGHNSAAKLPGLLLYNSALFKRHGLRVRSLLVLLRRGADSPRLTGLYERGFPNEPFDVALRYRVRRVWQAAPEQWLAGGLGLVPLAPLGDVRQRDLPAVIARMKQRPTRRRIPRRRSIVQPGTIRGANRTSGRSDNVPTADISNVAKRRTFLLSPDILSVEDC